LKGYFNETDESNETDNSEKEVSSITLLSPMIIFSYNKIFY